MSLPRSPRKSERNRSVFFADMPVSALAFLTVESETRHRFANPLCTVDLRVIFQHCGDNRSSVIRLQEGMISLSLKVINFRVASATSEEIFHSSSVHLCNSVGGELSQLAAANGRLQPNSQRHVGCAVLSRQQKFSALSRFVYLSKTHEKFFLMVTGPLFCIHHF